MNAAHVALFEFLAPSAISCPVTSTCGAESAGDAQRDACGESCDRESLDEADDYDSYGEEEGEAEEKEPAD